jgi:hypothetical protein
VNRSDPHFVYRCFDADGALLYIGCSGDPAARVRKHASRSEWFADCADITVQEYPHFWAARAAEDEAIYTERPLHNRNGGGRYRSEDERAARRRRQIEHLTRSELALLVAKQGLRVEQLDQQIDVAHRIADYMRTHPECRRAGDAMTALGMVAS